MHCMVFGGNVMRCIVIWGKCDALHSYLGKSDALHSYLGKCDALHSYWRTSSATKSAVKNTIHPPETEINPPKTAFGCTCVAAIKIKIEHTRHPLTLRGAFVNLQLHILCDSQ